MGTSLCTLGCLPALLGHRSCTSRGSWERIRHCGILTRFGSGTAGLLGSGGICQGACHKGLRGLQPPPTLSTANKLTSVPLLTTCHFTERLCYRITCGGLLRAADLPGVWLQAPRIVSARLARATAVDGVRVSALHVRPFASTAPAVEPLRLAATCS